MGPALPVFSSDGLTWFCASALLLQNTAEESACGVARQRETHSVYFSSRVTVTARDRGCVYNISFFKKLNHKGVWP